MESILHESFTPSEKETIYDNQPRKLQFLKFLNLIFLVIFGVIWSLNFIFVGWYGAYTSIMLYSLFIGILNALFVIGKHNQRLRLLQIKSFTIILYIGQFIAAGFFLGFLIFGCLEVEKYTQQESVMTKEELQRYKNSKWIIIFSVMFLLQSLSFTSYLKEFKQYYVDQGGVEQQEDSDEENEKN